MSCCVGMYDKTDDEVPAVKRSDGNGYLFLYSLGLFEHGNLIQKAKAMVPLLVPLFVSAFRRAEDLAMAMEARCYNGGAGRTKMKPLKYEANDHNAYMILILFLVVVLLLGSQ